MAKGDVRLFGGTIRSALVHAATRYDERQSHTKSYNHYALPQYFARIDDVMADIAKGASPVDAVKAGFHGPLLRTLLKAIGAPLPTKSDMSGEGRVVYQPVSSRA